MRLNGGAPVQGSGGTMPGEILSDEALDRIIGGKKIRNGSSGRGPKRVRKARRVRTETANRVC